MRVMSSSSAPRFAYVTLVMRGDAYVIGALVLAKSLKWTKTTHETVCMVTDDVSAQAVSLLRQAFDRVELIEYIDAPCRKLNTEKQERMYGEWTHLSLTAFRCLLLEDYDKICLMDSDVVVLRNMDNIFELNTPAASFFSFWYKKAAYTGLIHGGRVCAREIQQALSRPGSYVCTINCLLLSPSVQHAGQFMKCIEEFARKNKNLVGFPGVNNCINDQMISHFYTNYLKVPWTHVGEQYQTIPWKKKPESELPYLFHYFNINPWTMGIEEFPDLAVWWMVAQVVCEENNAITEFVPEKNRSNLEAARTYSHFKCLWCDKTGHDFCKCSRNGLIIMCPLWV
jgi:alpha-N-acetylglucosamine transferase